MDNSLAGLMEMVLPMVLMIGVGMLCRKKGIVNSEGVISLKTIALYVFLPALLVRAFSAAHYDLGILVIAVAVYIASILALGAGFLLRRLAHTPRITPFVMTTFEGGMVGFALFALWFGIDAVTDFAIVNIGHALFVWSFYMMALRRDQTGERSSFAAVVKSMVTSPVMIAIVAGVIMGASGLSDLLQGSKAGRVFFSMLDFAAAPVSAVILFIVGFELSLKRKNMKTVLLVVAVRIVVMVCLCAALLIGLDALIGLDTQIRWALVLLFTLPTAYVLTLMTKNREDTAFAATVTSLQTIITLVVFVIMVFISQI